MNQSGSEFQIGQGDWWEQLKGWTDRFDKSYWNAMRPCSYSEIEECQRQVGRELPPDFVEFLLRVGAGSFSSRPRSLYTPKEIVDACPGPIWMLLGSTTWTTDDAHRQFYASRGEKNPLPSRFTDATLRVQGVSLLDLLQVGLDGQCCYYQLQVGKQPRPFGCCLLSPEGTFEQSFASFSDAIRDIVGHDALLH
jgi:hypothetical protein